MVRPNCFKGQRTRGTVHKLRKAPTTRAALALFSGAVFAVGLAQPPASASGPANAAPSAAQPSCGWPVVVGASNYNHFFPDSAAAYWGQPFVAGPSTSITITGTYPDSRYFALSVYTPYGAPFSVNGVGASLPDYRVAPEQGSVNPWQHRAAPGGSYRVTVRWAVAPGEPNVLPLPPGTSAAHPGFLEYRVYLPANGGFSRLVPPAVTLARGSVSRTLPACRTHVPVPTPAKAPGATTPPAPKVPPPPGALYKPRGVYGGLGPDPDTAYVWAYFLRPAPTDVLVVSAKAPTFPAGSGPSPWPEPGEDVQYWSMCIAVGTSTVPTVANRLAGGQVDYGCRADEATKLNAAGYYSYVIGSEAERAAISRVAGATFLPFSSTQTTPLGRPWPLYLLLLRNVLVNPHFKHSVQKVTQMEDAPAAAAAMGRYYPRLSTCPLVTLTTKGLSACETH